MARDRKLKNTFGTVSGLYDSARVGYPQDLINDVVLLSRIPNAGKIVAVVTNLDELSLN